MSALALFLVVLTLLAVQMRDGGDPALGAGTATAPRRARHVLVHRVVRRVVVVHVPAAPSASAPPTEAPPQAAPPASSAPPPAPVAPAPAPAPPPAPVVTRAS